MAFQMPSEVELMELAEANYFQLSEEELEAFTTMMPGMFELYDDLDLMPLPKEPLKYPNRDSGYRPPTEEDPLNAIIRRCNLKGAPTGKLAGKRIGLKNNICVAGMPMTLASRVLDGCIPESDATIVTRLLDEGAEIVALLNMDSMAYSGGADTSDYGRILNPHNPEHTAGGSSSGSGAALYYDYIDITIGGDQAGSIRIPSSFCGVVGLKPTHTLVPYTGCVGNDGTLDHAGPLARTVADVALTLEVIAGKDPMDHRQDEVPLQPYTQALGKGVNGLRIGILSEGFGLPLAEPDVEAAVRKAVGILNELGAQVTEVSVPEHRHAMGMEWSLVGEGFTSLWQNNGMYHHVAGLYDPGLVETIGKFRQTQSNDLPPWTKFNLLLGTYMREKYHGRLYAKAQILRRGLRAKYNEAFEQVDLLVMPTTAMKAHRHNYGSGVLEKMTTGGNMLDNTSPFDVAGNPALNVPCAKSNGLPVGMMLVAKHFDDATLFQAAHAFEQHVDWETL